MKLANTAERLQKIFEQMCIAKLKTQNAHNACAKRE
jgi:hypothetical protein